MNGIAQIDGQNDLPWVILEKSAGDVEHYDCRSRLKRVFAIDNEICPDYGGKLRVFACIEDSQLINKTFGHVRARDEAAATVPPFSLLV